jgi:flagellar motor switch/type III secretory pathway protein FliN
MILKASKRLRKFFNKDLTDEMIWNEIIEEGRLHNIHQLTHLSEEAARSLIQHEKRMLLLTLGIAEMSPEVAAQLAAYKGEKLYLNGVKALSLDSARAIAQFKGIKLSLNAIKNVTLSMLGRLSAYRGSLSLDGLDNIDISPNDARRAETVFSNLKFSKLSMTSIDEPTDLLLKALARFPGYLELNGITNLSAENIKFLTEHPGKGLALKGIKVISSSLSKLLRKYNGFIDLSGAREVEDELLYIVARRPDGFTLFSPAVRKRIDEFRAREEKNNSALREEKRKKEAIERENSKKAKQLLDEFEKFDELVLTSQAPPPPIETEKETDPFESEVNDEILEDIELNLNLKINRKRRDMKTLLSKGMSNLSPEEKKQLQVLRYEIEELNDKIRGALDILVERKELGAVVFDNSNDLAAYLEEVGNEDEDDALANIEKKDMFGSSFEIQAPTGESYEIKSSTYSGNGNVPDSTPVEGEDFVFTAVNDD